VGPASHNKPSGLGANPLDWQIPLSCLSIITKSADIQTIYRNEGVFSVFLISRENTMK
jgi:hypothetical protein